MSSSNKNLLKPDQWYNDPRFNLIIRPKGAPEEGCKAQYKVQSLIFQMKSPYFARELEKLYNANPTDVPTLELPDSFNHGVYEDIHMELMGYQPRKLRREKILDYYFISFVLQLEDKGKYLKYLFDQGSTKSAFIWEVYGLACKLKDEDLRDEVLKYLESKSFKPLVTAEKEEPEMGKIHEEDFRFLIKIHHDKRNHAKIEAQKDFLSQLQIFELCQKYTKLKGFVGEKSRSLCKDLLVTALLTSEEFDVISKTKFFSSRDESAFLQAIFKRNLSVLRKESDLIRNQAPRIEQEILELRQRLENLGGITVPKVYYKALNTFDIQGHDYMVIDKMELPRGKYILKINFYGKHKNNNQSMFWMYLYLYKNGVALNSYPNSGWYGYNPDPSHYNPYELVHVIKVDNDSELIEFKGYSGGSYDATLTNIHMIAKEILEEVGPRQTPGRPE